MVGGAISMGYKISYNMPQVSFIILRIVDTPIKKSKWSAEKVVPVAKYLKKKGELYC